MCEKKITSPLQHRTKTQTRTRTLISPTSVNSRFPSALDEKKTFFERSYSTFQNRNYAPKKRFGGQSREKHIPSHLELVTARDSYISAKNRNSRHFCLNCAAPYRAPYRRGKIGARTCARRGHRVTRRVAPEATSPHEITLSFGIIDTK